ncbi:MAG: hypothetical protein AB7O88_00680 [Reyranellaceae bacterium]
MRQIRSYGDQRHQAFCVHCGGRVETLDHAPSKVFLDEPYPENLPKSPSCLKCNNGFSLDEQYLACLIECVVVGVVDPAKVERSQIARVLRETPKLAERLRRARREHEDRTVWQPENPRVERVILKLARAHVAFECNEPRPDAPASLWFKPLIAMVDSERTTFEERPHGGAGVWPEVGSRTMARLAESLTEPSEGWLIVQDDRYRYRVSCDGYIRVQAVIREYLAFEVNWD